ncbi:BREX-2 system phosphatase PglZ [Nocardia sp. NPDC059177]|uniref:BREX-2 system phosphatase PglZ n=1 Tax=Nocardia sp. NPDC059177 TaxID=3346759 RepID=UPI0036BD251B
MTSTTSTGVLRLSRSTVAQYLSSHGQIAKLIAAPGAPVTVLLRGEPVWEGDSVLSFGDGRRVEVAVAASPLAVHEEILGHARKIDPDPRVLVLVTAVDDHDVDPAILVRAYGNRIRTVDQWEIVRESFGATGIDTRLKQHRWACEALLDAAGARGWPTTMAGGVLARVPALAALTARRLRIPTDSDRIDPYTLLTWTLAPGGPQLLLDLRAPERDGIIEFLGENEQSGATGSVVAALTRTGHAAEAIAYGLVCAALWTHARPDSTVYQARGRVERWLGDHPPAQGQTLDEMLSVFGRTCEQYVDVLLEKTHADADPDEEVDEPTRTARQTKAAILLQADLLVRQFGADEAATSSPILPAGLAARFAAAGRALENGRSEEIDRTVTAVRKHRLATDQRVRISRLRMAQRLDRWLQTRPDPTENDSVAAALDRQMHDTAWADRALDYLDAGGDEEPTLRVAYAAIADRARSHRREFDREFAKNLAIWTDSGTPPKTMLTVETFLHRVVRPLAADHRVLLIVVDGMSAAIATELAGELRSSFSEFDPLPGTSAPRRRCMAAALPSLTAVSRTSLFAGKLMKGDQKTEKKLFREHSFWGARRAEVFHKDNLRSQAGDRFGTDLTQALADPNCHVAVVLNTIDDRLGKEAKLDDSGWQAREIGDLQALVSVATAQGMVVLITSDHGHVVDRKGVTVTATDVASARHRVPVGEFDRRSETEIPLQGPRVVWPEPGASIVALWDNDSRYTAQKAGYHGGAALAEITIPVLAFLPFGALPPNGWRELGDQRPNWWRDPTDVLPIPAPASTAKATATAVSRKAADKAGNQITLDIVLPEPAPIAAPANPADALVAGLLASAVFEAQLEQLARKPTTTKLEKAIRALLDGPQSTTALAQRVGDPVTRGSGFAAILGQLLNVDGVQVLETMQDGRTLRLHVGLLRAQFGLG